LSNDSDFLTGISESGWISETSYNFQNLENGQTYFFRVKSKDKHGEETDYSEKTSTTIDTLPPSGITVSNDGNYSVSPKITFHWTNFTDTGGSGIDHFEVQVSTDNTFETTLFSDTHYETLQKSLEGIQGEKYFARVRAIDKVGNKSD
jgi:predicted phage tail protein